MPDRFRVVSAAWFIAVLLGAFVVCSCGDDDAPSDAGSTPEPVADAGALLDASAALDAAADAQFSPAPVAAGCTGDLPVMQARDLKTNTEFDADWSCYEPDAGDRADEDADAGDVSSRPATFGFALPTDATAAMIASVVAGVTVDFFFEPSTLGAPAVTRVFDADSAVVALTVPAGIDTVSVRIHEFTPAAGPFAFVDMRQYGLVVPAGGAMIEGAFLVRDSRALGINLALDGGKDDPKKALIISSVRDCRGLPVSGALFELIDGETNEPVPTGGAPGIAHSSYSQFGLPTATCAFTSNQQTDASWMMVDAPVNVADGAKTHSYRLRLKGRMHAGDVEPVAFGESEVELFAGGTTSVRLYR